MVPQFVWPVSRLLAFVQLCWFNKYTSEKKTKKTSTLVKNKKNNKYTSEKQRSLLY